MAASLNILSKVVSSKVDGFFKTDTEENKEPPSKQELKVQIILINHTYRVSKQRFLRRCVIF